MTPHNYKMPKPASALSATVTSTGPATSNRGDGKPSVIGLVECPAATQQARFRSGSEDTQGTRHDDIRQFC
jgi:hypothetical protein